MTESDWAAVSIDASGVQRIGLTIPAGSEYDRMRVTRDIPVTLTLDELGNYIATSDLFPDLMTQGDTPAEAHRMYRDLLEIHMRWVLEGYTDEPLDQILEYAEPLYTRAEWEALQTGGDQEA